MILLDISVISELLHDEPAFLPLFAGRILPFDQSCTTAYGETISRVEKGGNEMATSLL